MVGKLDVLLNTVGGGLDVGQNTKAQIVQGLMSITAIAVNGLSPEEVCKLTPVYVEEMGLKSALSPNRANGFLNMFNRVIAEAKILSET